MELDLEDLLLKNNLEYLHPDCSMVLAAIDDQSVYGHVEKIYKNVLATFHPEQKNFRRYSQSRGRSLLNLELILREAVKKRESQRELRGTKPREI